MSAQTAVPMSSVNQMSTEAFVNLLGGVYEHSPWVAVAVADLRPFADRHALQQAMKEAVEKTSDENKIALLKAHPEFAGKAATEGALTTSSTAEQSRLSLNSLPSAQHQRMQQYNRQFMDKFGFPGIVAVRLNSSVEQIFEQFDRRLDNDFESEVAQALEQVHAIVGFRLGDLLLEN